MLYEYSPIIINSNICFFLSLNTRTSLKLNYSSSTDPTDFIFFSLTVSSLRYLPRLAAALRRREPLLHVIRPDPSLLPTPARTGPGAEPEGEESCPKPHHQARAWGPHRHGHTRQHRHPRRRHELRNSK